MTKPEELAYWLQGFFEITDAKVLTISQVSKIRAKVESCFEKVTPKRTSLGDEYKELKNNPTYCDSTTKVGGYVPETIVDTGIYNPQWGQSGIELPITGIWPEANPTFGYFANQPLLYSGKEPEQLWTIAGTDIKVPNFPPSFPSCQSKLGQFPSC